MCGIAGIFNFDGAPVAVQDLVRMSEIVVHRGPDDHGEVLLRSDGSVPPRVVLGGDFSAGPHNVGLANRRLAILDLSQEGHQPMSLGKLVLVYNGEIYNYLELSEELKSRGRTFRSHSDTEVLLHAYDEWGASCLDRLNGIFAFAIWDGERRKLFCARDRLGVKPFYYWLGNGRFVFCSEIKGLLAVVPQKPDVNEKMIFDFLTSGRLDHCEETFFQGIFPLPAGNWMEVDRGGISTHQYWDVSAVGDGSSDLAENIERFSELFRDSIRLQMRSDVPVSSCLSGGLDSSAVVSLAAPLGSNRMRVYTARFHDPSMDEWEYAKSVHKIKPIEPVAVFAESRDFWKNLSQLVWDQEEPFGGPSVFAQWTLMRRIQADGIKVVLDGQGGDELLCGYAKYFYYSIRDMLLRGEIAGLARAMLDALRGGSYLFNFADARRYLPTKFWLNRHKTWLLQPLFIARFAERSDDHAAESLHALQVLDIKRYSIPVLLRYEDKNSMSHSVESRVPFLDHRLVEFAIRLPTAHMIHGSKSKHVMRLALATDMPRKVLNRRSKLGFGGSYRSWITELAPEIEAWLAQPCLPVDRFVRRGAVSSLFRKRDPELFRVVILNRWLERFGYS